MRKEFVIMNRETKKYRKLLTFAAYIIVSLVAVIASIIGFNSIGAWQSFLLGLSTSCLVTVFVFLVLQFFLASSDHSLLSNIDDLISLKLLEVKYNTDEHESLSVFFNNLENEKINQLDMIGYSMAHVFQQHEKDIKKLLAQKVRIRVILTDPDSIAGNLMKEKVGSYHKVGEPHKRTLRYINNINNSSLCSKVKIEVSKVSWIPSCTIILGKRKNYFRILLGINGFLLGKDIDRRLYTVSASNVKDDKFTFFESHFDKFWEENKANIYTNLNEYLNEYE